MLSPLARARTARARWSALRKPAPERPERIVASRVVCLLGAPRTGKTSLVRRFVDRSFDEIYRPTTDMRTHEVEVRLPAGTRACTFRDLRGDEPAWPVAFQDLAGLAGYVLVVDGCRPDTFDAARASVERMERGFGSLPFVLAINKADRFSSWRPPAAVTAWLAVRSVGVVHTSARTGQGVNEAAALLAGRLGAAPARGRLDPVRVEPMNRVAASAG